jgi:hypothetical protein
LADICFCIANVRFRGQSGHRHLHIDHFCERKFSLSGEKSRLIPSYRDHPSTRSSFNILPIFVVYYPVKFAQLEDTMRHLGWLFAIAVAVLVIQGGKNTDSAGAVSTDTMRISMMHRHADQNMPVMVMDNPF